jgi:hypothetical protein
MLEPISSLFNPASPLLGREQPASTRLSRSLSWSGASAAQAARPLRRASTADAPSLTDSLQAAHGSDPVSSSRTAASGLRPHQQETIVFLQQVQTGLRENVAGVDQAGLPPKGGSHDRHLKRHKKSYQQLSTVDALNPSSRRLAATVQHGKHQQRLKNGGYLDTAAASTSGRLAQKCYGQSKACLNQLIQLPLAQWNQKQGSELIHALRVYIKNLGLHPEPAYFTLREQAVLLAESKLSAPEFVYQAAQLMQQIAQISQQTLHWPMPIEDDAAAATEAPAAAADAADAPDTPPATLADTAQTATDGAATTAPDGRPADAAHGPGTTYVTNNYYYNNCHNTSIDKSDHRRWSLTQNKQDNRQGGGGVGENGPQIVEHDALGQTDPGSGAEQTDGRRSPSSDYFSDTDSLPDPTDSSSQTEGEDASFDRDSLPPPDAASLRGYDDQETGTDLLPDDLLPGNDASTETAPLSDQDGDRDDDMIEAEVMVDDASLAAKLQTEPSAPALTVTRARNAWELPIAPQPLPANTEVHDAPVDPLGDARFVSTLNIPAPKADKVISQIETTLVAPPDPVQVTLVPAVGSVRQRRPVPLAAGLDSTDAAIRPVAEVPPVVRTVASLHLRPVVTPAAPVPTPLTPSALDRSRLRPVKAMAEKARKQPFSDLELAWDAIGVGKIDHEKGVYSPKARPPKPEFDLAVLNNPRNAEGKNVFRFGADRVNALQFSTRTATQEERTDEPESETRTEI